MHETVELSINSWKSAIAKTAPWAILVGIFQYALRGMDTTQTAVEANNQAFIESMTILQSTFFELMFPLLFLLILIPMTMSLITRV